MTLDVCRRLFFLKSLADGDIYTIVATYAFSCILHKPPVLLREQGVILLWARLSFITIETAREKEKYSGEKRMANAAFCLSCFQEDFWPFFFENPVSLKDC